MEIDFYLIAALSIHNNQLLTEPASGTTITYSYDGNGNLTDDSMYKYHYDRENRIVKITKDSNNIAEFAYDALGRRIRKIDSAAGETTLYYHNYNWQVLI